MLQSRLAFRTLAKKSDELTIAIVPAGTSFPPLGRISVFSLLVLLRPVELGPVDFRPSWHRYGYPTNLSHG